MSPIDKNAKAMMAFLWKTRNALCHAQPHDQREEELINILLDGAESAFNVDPATTFGFINLAHRYAVPGSEQKERAARTLLGFMTHEAARPLYEKEPREMIDTLGRAIACAVGVSLVGVVTTFEDVQKLAGAALNAPQKPLTASQEKLERLALE
ncbi:MAG: hypothetical protein WC612_01905 [Bdellovibrionales bacterium]|jgi:hypothetical protein